jgi:hypothetical protein
VRGPFAKMSQASASVMAITKCPIPAPTVNEFTPSLRAARKCARTSDWIGPFAGLMEKIMSKTPMHNSEASFEVRELKDELSGEQLQKVSGGNPSGPGESSVSFHDFSFTHHVDKASPVLL